MNEGNTNPAIPDGDVGIVVPQDIQTQINTLMREWNDLSQYVTVENVSTLSGSRVLETDADMTPFAVVDEEIHDRHLQGQEARRIPAADE